MSPGGVLPLSCILRDYQMILMVIVVRMFFSLALGGFGAVSGGSGSDEFGEA